jgi:hypothetical protein
MRHQIHIACEEFRKKAERPVKHLSVMVRFFSTTDRAVRITDNAPLVRLIWVTHELYQAMHVGSSMNLRAHISPIRK